MKMYGTVFRNIVMHVKYFAFRKYCVAYTGIPYFHLYKYVA